MDSRRAQAAEAAGSPREDAARSAPSPAPHADPAALSRARRAPQRPSALPRFALRGHASRAPALAQAGGNRYTCGMKDTLNDYRQGFRDGRASMARSIAVKLTGSMPDEELASLLGLSPEELSELLRAKAESPVAPVGASGIAAHLRIVEPNFVRTLREARHMTQPAFAKLLGVHAHTICEWETSFVPVRIKAETYERLIRLR